MQSDRFCHFNNSFKCILRYITISFYRHVFQVDVESLLFINISLYLIHNQKDRHAVHFYASNPFSFIFFSCMRCKCRLKKKSRSQKSWNLRNNKSDGIVTKLASRMLRKKREKDFRYFFHYFLFPNFRHFRFGIGIILWLLDININQ